MAETVDTNSFKNGMHIELDGKVWRIVEFQHVKPGKGGAFVRTKLKSLEAGATVDRTFRAGEKFARVHTEMKSVQYLYDDGSDVHFMDQETFEQFALSACGLEDELPFMQPNAIVQVMAVNGTPRPCRRRCRRARRRRDRAGHEGRHRLERDEAGDAEDGRRRPGAALREHRRPAQGRPREKRHIPRASAP